MKFKYILLLFLSFSQNLFSQTKDTLWTRDVWPLYVINGVFSPDDQFIYATGASDSYGKPPYSVLKYDLQGNLITKIDTIGGIRQFSEDGRFFWNYDGDKYDANTFQRLASLPVNLENWVYWTIIINEKSDFGILCGEGTVNKTEFQNFFDSNLIVFELTSMVVQKVTSHPDKAYWLSHPTINSDGTNLAIIVGVEKRNDEEGYYTDSVHIEIWRIPTLEKVAKIQLEKSKGSLPVILKYSPDGSVLGYQHDGKLTLYSTTDYSIIWENNDYSYNFCWSPNMEYIYISDFTTKKINYSTKKIDFEYKIAIDPAFYSFNKTAFQLLTSTENWRLILLDNNITSVDDFFISKDFKLNLIQNQSTNEFSFKINAPESAVGNYTISNMLGEILQNPTQINISEGSNQFELNTADFPTGIYFLTLTISGKTQTLKFAVVR